MTAHNLIDALLKDLKKYWCILELQSVFSLKKKLQLPYFYRCTCLESVFLAVKYRKQKTLIA